MKNQILILLLALVNADVLRAANTPPSFTDSQREAIYRQAQARKISGDEAISRLSSIRITFYGKVVDQNQVPLAGADVVYKAMKNLFGEDAERRTKTDKNGCFEINDRGLALDIEVSKDGYRKVTSSEKKQGSDVRIEYAEPDADPKPRSTKAKPMVFQLWKVGQVEALIHQSNQLIKFSPKGVPGFWSLNDRKESRTPGAHRVEISFLTDCPAPGYVGRPRFDWSFEIKIENGELVEQEDADGFEAPATGYRASDKFVMKKESSEWSEAFSARSYYIRFNDGVHARITIDAEAALDAYGAPVVLATSYLNLKAGSRYLEAPLPPPER